MEPDDLLCSRNARSRTPLVGRAQWKINQLPSLERERAGLEGSSLVIRCGLAGLSFEHFARILSRYATHACWCVTVPDLTR